PAGQELQTARPVEPEAIYKSSASGPLPLSPSNAPKSDNGITVVPVSVCKEAEKKSLKGGPGTARWNRPRTVSSRHTLPYPSIPPVTGPLLPCRADSEN